MEINQRKSKWVGIWLVPTPPNQPDQYYFDSVGKAFDVYAENCENFLRMLKNVNNV